MKSTSKLGGIEQTFISQLKMTNQWIKKTKVNSSRVKSMRSSLGRMIFVYILITKNIQELSTRKKNPTNLGEYNIRNCPLEKRLTTLSI